MAGLPKILLVEDTAPIVDIYTQVLTNAGYPMRSVGTVDELLEVAPKFRPDIIFLDIMLPGGRTGLDALMLLRTDAKYKASKTKIVLLTNLSQDPEIEKMWEKYADGYVIKAEIDPRDLFDIIESLGFEKSSK